MKSISLLLLLIFLACDSSGQKNEQLQDIDQALEAILEVTKAPGFAVAVVQKDKLIYSKGFGYRDVENKIPVDANTLFAIGSSSKAFTSAILGQLRDDEKLSFEESPIKYIPELRFYNDNLNNKIIVKDLMTHRTGIPRHDASWYFFPTFNRDSLMMRIQHLEPFTGLREQWYYNNFMFLVQGVIAEKITGKSWEDNIRDRFFGPLEMKRSNVSIAELEKSSNAAFGYQLVRDSVLKKMDYYKIAGMRPAGSINSSVNEMANWLMMWINDGKYKDKEILSSNYVQEAKSSQMVINGGTPSKEFPDMHVSNYGYAWFISSYRGHYRVEHGGNIDGFSANAAFYPSDSIGIMVLANQNGSSVPTLVRNTIADRMLGVEKTDWAAWHQKNLDEAKEKSAAAKDQVSSGKVTNTSPSHIPQEFTGEYSNAGYGKFKIELENDSLFVLTPLDKSYLRHHHYDVFEMLSVTDEGIDTSASQPLKVNFRTNDSGDIASASVKLEPTLDPILFKRTPNLVEVDKSTLERYVGTYEMPGVVIEFYIKGEDVLYAFVAGQPEYELLPTAKHKFSFKIIDGFKVEFHENDGVINKVTVFQPHGNFTATRKK